jgi:hypothetical protein
MPQIIVAADRGAAFGDGAVTFRETVNVEDFESRHFAGQLVERIGWAVEDAAQAERSSAPPEKERLAAPTKERLAAPTKERLAAPTEEQVAAPPEAHEKRDERVILPSPA